MNTPTKTEIRNAGYRMSANAGDEIVARAAQSVKSAYLLHHVTEAQITAASATDEIGAAWLALTFLAYCQDVEFGTRTGGEKKRFDYGDHVKEERALKADCALKLKALQAVHPATSKVSDICEVYFRTQLFN